MGSSKTVTRYGRQWMRTVMSGPLQSVRRGNKGKATARVLTKVRATNNDCVWTVAKRRRHQSEISVPRFNPSSDRFQVTFWKGGLAIWHPPVLVIWYFSS